MGICESKEHTERRLKRELFVKTAKEDNRVYSVDTMITVQKILSRKKIILTDIVCNYVMFTSVHRFNGSKKYELVKYGYNQHRILQSILPPSNKYITMGGFRHKFKICLSKFQAKLVDDIIKKQSKQTISQYTFVK